MEAVTRSETTIQSATLRGSSAGISLGTADVYHDAQDRRPERAVLYTHMTVIPTAADLMCHSTVAVQQCGMHS